MDMLKWRGNIYLGVRKEEILESLCKVSFIPIPTLFSTADSFLLNQPNPPTASGVWTCLSSLFHLQSFLPTVSGLKQP